MSAGHVRLSLSCFHFFLAGSFDTIWWRAQSRHKSQHWLSSFGCTLQIWTRLLSVGHVFLSVGPMYLSVTFEFYTTGKSLGMAWPAQSRLKYQHWQGWHPCMPQVWSNFLSVDHVVHCVLFICFFSQLSSSFSAQVPQLEWLNGHGPAANFDVDQAECAVCPKMERLLRFSHVLDWALVLRALSHVFKRSAFRHLDKNKFSGTIFAEISALGDLNTLYSPLLFIECWPAHFSNSIWSSVTSTHNVKRSIFVFRSLSDNWLDGTIPGTISTLTKLTFLCVHM